MPADPYSRARRVWVQVIRSVMFEPITAIITMVSAGYFLNFKCNESNNNHFKRLSMRQRILRHQESVSSGMKRDLQRDFYNKITSWIAPAERRDRLL